MTDKLFAEIWADAQQITDIDAFSSDWALSSALLPEDADMDPILWEQLRIMWHVAHDKFKGLLQQMGLKQTGCATRFCIPLRTVQGWALGERECTPYIRLMMAEATGYLRLRDYGNKKGE